MLLEIKRQVAAVKFRFLCLEGENFMFRSRETRRGDDRKVRTNERAASRASSQTPMITTTLLLSRASRKMTSFKVAVATKQDEPSTRSSHRLLLACFCHAPTEWQRFIALYDIEGAAYMSWWVIRTISWARLKQCPVQKRRVPASNAAILASITSVRASRLRIPSSPRVTSCPLRQYPHRHGNNTAEYRRR